MFVKIPLQGSRINNHTFRFKFVIESFNAESFIDEKKNKFWNTLFRWKNE